MSFCKEYYLYAALLVLSLTACGPPHESDEKMLRLAIKLGQPDRVLSHELLRLAMKEGMSVSSLEQAATRIINTRARFDDEDKTLAVAAVKFAAIENIQMDRSTDLVTAIAYDLELGEDVTRVLSMGTKAEERTPNLTGADAVQLVCRHEALLEPSPSPFGRPLEETCAR